MAKKDGLFKTGLKDGLPIGIGYLPVAFTLGVNAQGYGHSMCKSLAMSALSFTGVGQMTLMDLMSRSASYIGIFMSLLLINLRNIALSLSLAQRIDGNTSFFKKLIMSMGNTDEIFALTIRRKGQIPTDYFLGVMTLPYVAWMLGTLAGGIIGDVLPSDISIAMKMALYGMLIASVVPAAKASKPILFVSVLSGVLSCILQWIEPLKELIQASGILIIGSLLSAVLAAVLFPVEDKEEK